MWGVRYWTTHRRIVPTDSQHPPSHKTPRILRQQHGITINRKTHLMSSLVERKRSYAPALRRTTTTLTVTRPMGVTRPDSEAKVLGRTRSSGDSRGRHLDSVECGLDLERTKGSPANPLPPFIGQTLRTDQRPRPCPDQHVFRVHNTTPVFGPYGTPPFNPY